MCVLAGWMCLNDIHSVINTLPLSLNTPFLFLCYVVTQGYRRSLKNITANSQNDVIRCDPFHKSQKMLFFQIIYRQKGCLQVSRDHTMRQTASGNHLNWIFHVVISQARPVSLTAATVIHQEAVASPHSLETRVSVFPQRNTEMVIAFTQVQINSRKWK